MQIPGHSPNYVRELSRIADAYSNGDITADEFHKQMATLREGEIEYWRKELDAQGRK